MTRDSSRKNAFAYAPAIVLGLMLLLCGIVGWFRPPDTGRRTIPLPPSAALQDDVVNGVVDIVSFNGIDAVDPLKWETTIFRDDAGQLFQAIAVRHWGPWSLLPALIAVIACVWLREPLAALFLAVAGGGLLLGQYDIIDEVLMTTLASASGAGILILYLWLLGALMGIWSKNGAAEAFAQWATRRIVVGPRSAKLVAWTLGVIFFQGGTISTVLVGTAVKPVADRQRISHEELSYIVDSTASPIAILVALNAWPLYVQSLLFVPGIDFLATQDERLSFFFRCLPLSFYAWLAVVGTFFMAIDRPPIVGRRMRDAMERSRKTGQLDRPGSQPMAAPHDSASSVPPGYRPSPLEFVGPLVVLTLIAIGTFAWTGSPQVRIAFGVAVVLAAGSSLFRGMSLADLMDGIGVGLRGVVVASVILLLAVTLGSVTKQTGAADYLVALIGGNLPHWGLPGILFGLTIAIALATGSSWGTYAVAFPLAMPLAVSIAAANGLAYPQWFVAVCFAAVLNGSVVGDQCSPISDTTVLSCMTTGADLMDHVLTQSIPASAAAFVSMLLWTMLAMTC